MKKIFLGILMLSFSLTGFSQFDGFEIEEVDNGGIVPGTTYRVYVKLKSVGDGVDIVFGAPGLEMNISSTKPFYQHKDGGVTSNDIGEMATTYDPKVAFDSFVTIGRLTDANNELTYTQVNEEEMGIGEKSFEDGGPIRTDNGGWFCIPLKPQTVCGEDRKILIAQLTTKGKVTGIVNLQGKLKPEEIPNDDGTGTVLNHVSWRADQAKFTCGD